MKKFVIYLLAVVLAAVSCNKKETASMNVAPSYAVLSYKGGIVETNLTCNTGWRAKVDTTYERYKEVVVTPDTTQGDRTVKIEIPENIWYETQHIRINFTASNGTSTASTRFVVTQDPAPFVTADPEVLTIGAAGGGLRFDIVSNDNWEFAGQSLVEDGTISDFFPVSGKFNASAGVTVSPNGTGEVRTVVIPFVISSDKDIKGYLTIIQASTDVI